MNGGRSRTAGPFASRIEDETSIFGARNSLPRPSEVPGPLEIRSVLSHWCTNCPVTTGIIINHY